MIHNFFKKIQNFFFKKGKDSLDDLPSHLAPKIIPRKNHFVSRTNVSSNALKILYRLKKNGYMAYLVGGCIRDILLDIAPKDFDIVTDAKPNEIKRLFRNCRLIGRRFRIAHIYFGYEIIEVTTFRSNINDDNDTFEQNPEADIDSEVNKKHNDKQIKNNYKHNRKHNEQGMIIADNLFGNCIMQDALRRDFTINALYYNIRDFSLVDYVNAIEDIKLRQIKLIGNPVKRYKEDPVRMLRAVRFACKLDFEIEVNTEQPMYELGHLLQNVPAARLAEEFNKLFFSGYSYKTFTMLRKYDLFKYLFYQTEVVLLKEEHDSFKNLIHLALRNTDERFAVSKQTSSGFLLAVLLWEPIYQKAKNMVDDQEITFNALEEAIELIILEIRKNISFTRNVIYMMKEICLLQLRLSIQRCGRKANHTFSHPKFRAGYDFLLLRAKNNDEQAAKLVEWWNTYMHQGEKERWLMAKEQLKIKKKFKKKKVKQKRMHEDDSEES